MSTGQGQRDTAEPHRFCGRRCGRRLRPGRRALLETLLPKVALAPPRDVVDPRELFDRAMADVWLEIGFGAGEHLVEQASVFPHIGLIGCEAYVNGVAALLAQIARRDLKNIRIFADDARLLLDRLAEASIGRVFVLFPDPWPKPRHHHRRLIAPATLDALARALKDGGELRFASDHMGYVRWTLERVMRHPAFIWTAEKPVDWRSRPADAGPTRYETKAKMRNAKCVYLRLERRRRN